MCIICGHSKHCSIFRFAYAFFIRSCFHFEANFLALDGHTSLIHTPCWFLPVFLTLSYNTERLKPQMEWPHCIQCACHSYECQTNRKFLYFSFHVIQPCAHITTTSQKTSRKHIKYAYSSQHMHKSPHFWELQSISTTLEREYYQYSWCCVHARNNSQTRLTALAQLSKRNISTRSGYWLVSNYCTGKEMGRWVGKSRSWSWFRGKPGRQCSETITTICICAA